MENFRLGIIGTGWIADQMANTVKGMNGVELYAVASRKLETAQAFQSRYGVTKAYGSYEEMVSDDNVQLVYVATPHSHHYENVMLCLDHKKPVLCEKAFTATAWQAEEIIERAHKENIFITEAIWTRYMPLSKTIKETVDSGIIGTPKMISANLCYPNIDKPRMYLPELAGGALLDLGVYTLNFAAMIFGTDIEKTVSTAMMTDTGVDSQNNITLHYTNDRMSVLTSSNLVKSDRQGIISGDKGHIIVENINNPERMTIVDNDYQVIKVVDCPKKVTGYEYQVYASMEAIRAGKIECPDMPHEETIRIMRQMDELRKEWGVRYPWDRWE